MRIRTIALLLAISSAACAEHDLRSGAPKECFLYSWGKGPNWITKLSTEFRLSLLDRQMPYVDDQYFEPTDKALAWTERQKEPTVTTIAAVDGRKVIRVEYPEGRSFGKTLGMILFAMETAHESEWFSPFFAAQPELFRGQFVTGRDVAFGFVATLAWSGTGAIRAHYLFDLRKPHPKMVSTVNAGRVRRVDFKTDAEYERASTVFDQEADLFAGIVASKKSGKRGKR
jgi:hypothetical protein